MKKFIAGILAALCTSLGVVMVDKTIERRVETLESEVASLKEVCLTIPDDINQMVVGDTVQCLPEAPFILEGTCLRIEEADSETEQATELIDALDEGIGNFDYIFEDVSAQITSVTATVVEKLNKTDDYSLYTHPYRVKIVIRGSVDPKYSGLYLFLYPKTQGIAEKPHVLVSDYQIPSGGSFEITDYYYFGEVYRPVMLFDELNICNHNELP